MLSELGLSVSRLIPAHLVPGVLSGAFTLHGGVIRDLGGQIVAHLALPAQTVLGLASLTPLGAITSAVSSVAANFQLLGLKRDVAQVAQLSMASTTMAGLGLATGLVGFIYVSTVMKRVDGQVKKVFEKTEQVKAIMESTERAQLCQALDDYKVSTVLTSDHQRIPLLRDARTVFGRAAHHYSSRMSESEDFAEVFAAEGYFVTACIGNALSCSDLGHWDEARQNFEGHYDQWRATAQTHCAKILALDEQERLLDKKYVEVLPVAQLVRVLDFAHGGAVRGIDRIDELRAARERGLEWSDIKKICLPFGKQEMVEPEQFEFVKRLCHRDDVLKNYRDHFAFLKDKEISAHNFSRLTEDARISANQDVVWITPEEFAA